MSDYVYRFNNSLATLVSIDLKAGLVPMLIGEPGIGKSSWVRELASRLHARYFCLACNQLAAKEDMTGARLVPIENPDGTTDYEQRFWPHTVVKQAMRYATEHPDEQVLLFMDELNRTTPDVTSELLSIPTMRSIGDQEIPLSPGVCFVAPPGRYHSIKRDQTVPCVRLFFFHADIVARFFGKTNQKLTFLPKKRIIQLEKNCKQRREALYERQQYHSHRHAGFRQEHGGRPACKGDRIRLHRH